MKVLVDEMYDGMDTKLKEFGYEAYSVKKLITEGKKLSSDYSVIKYAQENGMIMVTEDTEVGKACKENNIPCVLLDNDTIFKIILEELGNFKTL
jgi:rRNA-processing protein FCF1